MTLRNIQFRAFLAIITLAAAGCSAPYRDEPAPGGLTLHIHESGIDQSGSVTLQDGSVDLGNCDPDSVIDLGGGIVVYLQHDYENQGKWVISLYKKGSGHPLDVTKRVLSDGKMSVENVPLSYVTIQHMNAEADLIHIEAFYYAKGNHPMTVEIPRATIASYAN